MDDSTLDNSFLETSFVENIVNDNSCSDSTNLNVNLSSQPNTGNSDSRSHHSMSPVQPTNEQHAQQRSDCMYQTRTATPQPGCSGMSSSTPVTVPGTGDYPAFHQSTTQNGYQRPSEASTNFSRINYFSQDDHQIERVGNTSSVLGSGQQHRYFAAGQLPDHPNVRPWQSQNTCPTQTSRSGYYDGYPASTVNTHLTNVNNHAGMFGSANCTPYEAFTMAYDPRVPVGQSMSYNHQNATPMSMTSYPSHGTSNSFASTSGMPMNQYMAQLRPHTDIAGMMQHSEPSTSMNQTAIHMPNNPGILVPHGMQTDSITLTKNDEKKPSASYLQLIADALLASEQGVLVVGDIIKAIMNKYVYYQNCKTTWKGGIRHNLSVNNCFHMVRESNFGRGRLWAIHHSCLEYFRTGQYNRRAVNQIVQHWHNQNGPNSTTANEQSSLQHTTGQPPAATDGNNPRSPPTVSASSAQQQDAPATQD